ncbi:Protein C34F6.1 [Aphelenchoides avenae]|nr:Protein C34F6.1 [Aphelenchus avenae]
MNKGTGTSQLPRWHFDIGSNGCEEFTYTGLKGNENNFISKQTCEERCPAHRNYCPHGEPQLDQLTRKPVPCSILKSCQTGFVCHMSVEFKVSVCCENPAHFCLKSRDPGPCSSFEKRYGYNPLTDSCVEYQYGGCDGSLNNFQTLEKCTEICCKEYKRRKMRDASTYTNATSSN